MQLNTTTYNANPKMVKVILLILGIVFTLVGTGLGIGSFFVNQSEQKLHDRCSKKTTGIIVDYDKHVSSSSKSGSSTTYAKVVEYEVKGDTYEITDKVSTSSKPKIGKKVTVFYNPKDPDEAYIKGSTKVSTILTIVCIPFSLVGIGLTSGAIVLFVKDHKREENYDL